MDIRLAYRHIPAPFSPVDSEAYVRHFVSIRQSLALALAFGLGGKDWAAAMLERWWPQRSKDDHRTL